MNDLFQLRRVGGVALLLTGWLAVSAPAGATPGERHAPAPTAWQPIFQPLAWHREHWRQQRQYDPALNIELPWMLFDPYFQWDRTSRPDEPLRPGVRQRERGDPWRDDVVGSGSGGRIEVHPEGRILRSRPRSD
ncbi:hypothetical protein [Halomonas sp. A29]|uniref:hypothetical protein n=1 Tax=Halomonas sp. A29 TaxID=3102786 RepID=UPI00398B99A9